jgi:Lamin Tail Domain
MRGFGRRGSKRSVAGVGFAAGCRWASLTSHLNRAHGRGVRRGFFSTLNVAFESLEPRNLLAASAVISEFLASNSAGIVDQDGNHSDWIEIQNTTTSALNIGGWYLTNDASNPVKWQFPSTTIAAGGFLTVFASGKDRHVSGQELHTNFSLDATGGYLALEMPDQSIASSFAPYPAQITDVSYGITGTSTDTDALVDEDAPLKYLVPPTTSTIASTWTSASFDDSTWTAGQSAVGYDTAPTASADYLTFINTNVGSQMNFSPQRNAAFIRYSFLLANPSQLTSLSLQLRYDDGFVAYLNGTEVARANFTGTPAPTSSASSSHTDSQAAVYQTFNVSSFLNKLVAGNNVLAIAGLNRSTDTSDFLIDPLLSANRVNPDPGFHGHPHSRCGNNPGSLGFEADTKFSVDRGFYTSPMCKSRRPPPVHKSATRWMVARRQPPPACCTPVRFTFRTPRISARLPLKLVTRRPISIPKHTCFSTA